MPRRPGASAFSLRAKVLLVVLGGAILPFLLLGIWLTQSAERSGRAALATRLDESLERIAQELSPRWIGVRSQVLSAVEDARAQQALAGTPDAPWTDSLVLGGGAGAWVLQRGDRAWALRRLDASAPALTVALPVYEPGSGRRLTVVDVAIPAAELIPPSAGGAVGIGSLLGAFDPKTGVSLLPLPVPPEELQRGAFAWDGERWVARFRTLDEPRLVLALAAPLTPYLRPFSTAARQGAVLLAIVTFVSSVLVVLFSRRLTRSLGELATAAEAVAKGDLEQRVDEDGRDEVGAVGRAFNTMTRNLRHTLDELSRQRGLASVGEFAASLAHEVRNPLTAIRIELQSAEEETSSPSARAGLERALRHVQRLEATVAGSLRVARGGTMALEPIDLREPLRDAWRVAAAEFDARGGVLQPIDPGVPVFLVRGDAVALEQLFLNLLLNAAQALERGGEASGEVHALDGRVEVVIRDSGRGIAAADLDRIFEPLRSTRPEGTGLGLTIAQRIAQAHGGDISIESRIGAGTTVRVHLPRVTGGTP